MAETKMVDGHEINGVPSPATVMMWVAMLVPHPDNPRTVNTQSPKFADLVASIRANGILEPLTVRQIAGQSVCEVLSGHRRLAAAVQLELEWVPVRNLGLLGDERAYDIVAMANLHEELTPLEEGRRAACWLDKYGGDVEAVASKLGKTPAWVVQHAQIARGLSAEWQKEILETNDGNGRPKWSRWTAGHLAVIARLPVSLQAHYLQKVRSDYRFGYWPDWTVKQIEEAVKVDQLYLVKAPFEVSGCSDCVNRTDRQPLLWGDATEAATGDKARCLEKKCWEKKAAAYARKEFKAIAVDKGVPQAVPISLLEEPDKWSDREKFAARIRELKKQYGPKFLTADKVEVVSEGARDAVPAIVVAGARGRGHLAVKYIRPLAAESASRAGQPSAGELAERAEQDREQARQNAATERMLAAILEESQPNLAVVTVVGLVFFGNEFPELLEEAASVHEKGGEGALSRWIRDRVWSEVRSDLDEKMTNVYAWRVYEPGEWNAMGSLFGVDRKAIYDEIVATEKGGATEGTEDTEKKKEVPAKKGRRKAVTT